MCPSQTQMAELVGRDVAQSVREIQHSLQLVQRAFRDLLISAKLLPTRLACTLRDVQRHTVGSPLPLRAKGIGLNSRKGSDRITRQDRWVLRFLPCPEVPKIAHAPI